MTIPTFAELGLIARLQRSLKGLQYSNPTPIQQRAIPLQLEGADVLGIAQTGTGKTAAFVLPLLQNLNEDGIRPLPRAVRALILGPTRELAVQILTSIESYGRHMRLSHAAVMGGVSQRSQVEKLRRGVDVLVATPGRLVDLLSQGHVRLDDCDYLVIDEADRMLDMGFIKDVRRIVGRLPEARQTVLFSATMPVEVARLAKDILHEPRRVEVASRSMAVERIDQRVYHLAKVEKRALLTRLFDAPDLSKVIVFTRTKRGADRVAKQLRTSGIRADALHGNKSQNNRQRTLEKFRSGRTRALVATDVASRGIDIDDVTHVINFELPNEPECYVHRVGRTARAGAEGIAISLCDVTERQQLRAIESLIKGTLTVIGDAPADLPSTGVSENRRRHSKPQQRRHRRKRRQAARAA